MHLKSVYHCCTSAGDTFLQNSFCFCKQYQPTGKTFTVKISSATCLARYGDYFGKIARVTEQNDKCFVCPSVSHRLRICRLRDIHVHLSVSL